MLACRSYPYRHDIEGRVVVTAEGALLRPGVGVPDAVVQRINDNGEPYGFDDDYRRVTDAQGHFSFVAEGQGASPLAYAPWRIRVTHPNYGTRELEVRAAWSDDKSVCWGYCARDFEIELRKSATAAASADR